MVGMQAGTQLEESVSSRGGHRVSGMTHGDNFVVTGPTGQLADLRNKISTAYPRKTKKHTAEDCTGESEEWCENLLFDRSN